jgi:osmotically-inducible protein OsmY
MKAVVIVVTSALAAVACNGSGERLLQGRAGNSGNTATSAESAAGATRTVQASEADNTGINERDRQATTTPLDQGSSARETSITASIRRGIVADESLSFDGRNVKVVTVGNKVTLRGPVKTDQARVAIANIAKRTAGVMEVDNQLEVKN